MLHLFDTYQRKLRPFTPLNPPEVSLYACGLTVYDYAHIIFDQVLGLRLADWQPETAVSQPIPAEVTALLAQRQQARANKAWQLADALREQIIAAGYDVVDTPNGPELKSRSNNA